MVNVCTYQCKTGGREEGKAWGGDLTFFKNLQSNSLPTGKSLQTNATKFPLAGQHIAVKYLKEEPKLTQERHGKNYLQIKLCNLYL